MRIANALLVMTVIPFNCLAQGQREHPSSDAAPNGIHNAAARREGALVAQTVPPTQTPDARPIENIVKQHPEPPVDPDLVTIRAGEPVVLRTKAAFSTKTVKAGDTITFEVAKAVTNGDAIVIAEGATATAQVTLAEPAKRKGKGAKLALAFDKVELVDGHTASLRALTSENAGRNGSMIRNMVTAGILSYGMASPFFLLQHGHEITYRKGERFVAETNEDIRMSRPDVADHQPAPPQPRPDVATIFVIKHQIKGELLAYGGEEVAWQFSIGDQTYQLSPDSALRIELPPGKYWLHPTVKSVRELKPDDLLEVDAAGGQTYYFQFALADAKFRLIPVGPNDVKPLLAAAGVFVTLPREELRPDQLKRASAQPTHKK